MFTRFRRTHDAMPPLDTPEPYLRMPDILTASRPLDFDPVMAELPAEIPVGDERLNELILMIHAAAVNPIDRPLSLKQLPQKSDGRRTVQVTLPKTLREGADPTEYAIPIPVVAFVAAPEIVDWDTGRIDSKNGRSSVSVINDYAGRPAKTAAPIQHVQVYIRPDGAVYAALHGDGAHRLCAARRRGDQDILCRNATIIQL